MILWGWQAKACQNCSQILPYVGNQKRFHRKILFCKVIDNATRNYYSNA
ncbi:hypothetical protein [Helicobacter sp. UBA3407]|nr:hypothetical protein [Helicobacter sp. UBA3407]